MTWTCVQSGTCPLFSTIDQPCWLAEACEMLLLLLPHICAVVLQLKLWEEKARAVLEERTKQRAALETELRTLRAAQEELAAKFDESLISLQTASATSAPLMLPWLPLTRSHSHSLSTAAATRVMWLAITQVILQQQKNTKH